MDNCCFTGDCGKKTELSVVTKMCVLYTGGYDSVSVYQCSHKDVRLVYGWIRYVCLCTIATSSSALIANHCPAW